MIKKAYLIIKADTRIRVVTRIPNLNYDEVAIVLKFRFPDTWGRVIDDMTLDVPEFAPTVQTEGALVRDVDGNIRDGNGTIVKFATEDADEVS